MSNERGPKDRLLCLNHFHFHLSSLRFNNFKKAVQKKLRGSSRDCSRSQSPQPRSPMVVSSQSRLKVMNFISGATSIDQVSNLKPIWASGAKFSRLFAEASRGHGDERRRRFGQHLHSSLKDADFQQLWRSIGRRKIYEELEIKGRRDTEQRLHQLQWTGRT